MPEKYKHDTYPVMSFKTNKSFETWLEKNYAKSDGIWLKIAKKASGIKSVTQPEALDVVLCYGWIDGLRRGLDEDHFVQKYTPRRVNSNWSEINKNNVAELIKEGRMRDGGLAAIETAKNNGRWGK